MTVDTLMPRLNTTIEFLGGTITRTDDVLFQVKRANGVIWSTHRLTHRPIVGFISAINTLRKDAGLTTLMLPCSHCGINERKKCDAYCSMDCKRKAVGVKTSDSPRGCIAAAPRPYDFAALAFLLGKTLTDSDFAADPQSAIPLSLYRQQVDDLIRRRGGVVPREGYCRPRHAILDDVLARAERRRMLRTERSA